MNTSISSIMLIDDDQDDKYFFATALEEVDPTIALTLAADGLEALEKLETVKPDLILLDLVMPRMNGVNFLREFKNRKDIANIPVIVYTSDLSIFEEEEVLKLGALHVYIKPVDYAGTVKCISAILESQSYRNSA